MSYLGSWDIDDALAFYCNTTRFDTGAATDADAEPTYRVYENETGTALLNGTLSLIDSGNTAGFYSESITLSAANGFEVGKQYAIYIAATVNSVVGATHHTFQVCAKVNTTRISGTAQTARDIGASVLLSSGTGTGQLKLASGYVAMTWADIAAPTTTVNLSGTTIATTQKVDVETIKTNPVVNGGTFTFPTNATGASTTNITGGTITTVTTTTTATNLTNAPTNGDFTATMKTSITTAATAATPNLNAAYDAAKTAATQASVDTVDGVVDAIKVVTDKFTFTVPGYADCNIQYVNDVEVLGDGAGTPWGP
jgi:hypothetical protein